MQFTAKPRVDFHVMAENPALAFHAGHNARLSLHCQNVGRWYARPAATNLRVYINFDPALEPLRLKYGSQLERSEEQVQEVRRGKRNSKYMKAVGIQLFHGEPGEDVEMEVRMPDHAGLYKCWVAAYCDDGDCGIHEFTIKSRGRAKANTAVQPTT